MHIAETINAKTSEDETTVKVANNVEEAVKLIAIGFVEASDWGGVKIFKKRK